MKFPPGYVPGVGTPKPVTSSFGERLLASMGWEKGQGLGKNQHGIKEAIAVKNKQDTKGVGANTTSWDWSQRYWEDAYESAAKHIKEASSSSSSTATDASSSGYSSDDSDSSAGEHHHRDGTRCTATADELAIARELAKDPWGRFGGKEGKMARIRQQEAALLAAKTGSVVPSTPPTSAKRRTRAIDPTTPSKSSGKGKKRQKVTESVLPEGTAPKAAPLVIVIGQQEDGDAMQVDPTPSSSVAQGTWWGARYFSWGGLLGSGTKPQTETSQRRGFDEQDQEALYTRTHDGKVQGKQGLGRGARPGEVRGAGWKGTKVTFGEDEDVQVGRDKGGVGSGAQLRGIKWKAHVKRVLRQTHKRRMRTTKLAAAVCGALQADGRLPPDGVDTATLQATMVRKLKRSASFACSQKYVALAT